MAIVLQERKQLGLLKEYVGQTVPYTVDGKSEEPPYITRIDMFGNISKIAPKRADRPFGIEVVSCDVKPVEVCDFCNYQNSTPKERIDHEYGAISVPNKFPWEKYDWITIYPPFGAHKLLLSEMYFEDLESMMESSHDLATICATDPEVIGFMDFTNWGPYAGASQQHPHSQRRSITHLLDPVQKGELDRCKELRKKYGKNPFEMLREEERQDGRRIIYDNDIFLVASFAPSCPDEVLCFPNEDFSHILQMRPEDRRRIIRPLLGIFPALFFYRGVTNLNIAVHMAPLKLMEEARDYYRWHIHIYPRRARLPVDRAGAEIGFYTNVIAILPENSAEAQRLWYEHGPMEEHLVRSPEGIVNPNIEKEFKRIANSK